MDLNSRSRLAWTVLRILVAGLVAAHGYYRMLSGGVEGFGGWLTSQHVPGALVVAWAVTLSEVIGSVLLVAGRWFVFPTTLVLAAIYATGIVMVHAPSGWFVVGAGRNGAEYSVLLIAVLLCVGLQHCPTRDRAVRNTDLE